MSQGTLDTERTERSDMPARESRSLLPHREPVPLENLAGRERELAIRLNRVIEEAEIADRLLGQFQIDLNGTNTLYQMNLRALDAFRRLTRSLMGKADLHRICAEVVEAIVEEIGAERCSLMLLNEQVLRLEAAATSSNCNPPAGEHQTRVFLVGEGVAGQAVRSGQPIRIEDVERDPRWVPLKNAVSVRSILCIPLRANDDVLGVINLSHSEPGYFTLEHLRVLELLCPIVSQLISFARFHASLETANQGLADRLKDLEEQFRASQKMEAIGTLAGGIAHDFNNLLTVITCYSEMLLAGLGSRSPLHEHAVEIQRAADRASCLTHQLLAFSRRQMLAPRIINLNAVIENTTSMLQRLIGADIELSHVGDAALGCVKADPGQLEQVIMNLAVNARDAMPSGGRLIIQTSNVDVDDLYIDRHVKIPPGRFVVLMVSDTGVGMDAETQRRIFEPFYTTKEQGKGTGLGLSTVHGIVNQSGGHVTVYSEFGRGTTFKVYLPLVSEEEDVASVLPTESIGAAEGAATVLVAEDDDRVRTIVTELLTKQGYQVLAACNGEQALGIWELQQGRIDLLLTDLVMPGMSGTVLASKVREKSPDVSVIFMSGYADQSILQQGLLEVDSAFVQKPFSAVSLSRKVRDVLRARVTSGSASDGPASGGNPEQDLSEFCTLPTLIILPNRMPIGG